MFAKMDAYKLFRLSLFFEPKEIGEGSILTKEEEEEKEEEFHFSWPSTTAPDTKRERPKSRHGNRGGSRRRP